jgi:phospholipid/cholesterol/gamma-HCH transport system substrate-binding protein
LEERKLEVKVGALVVAALVVAAGLVWALGRWVRGPQTRFTADFAYAGGMPRGAPVKMAGVAIGRVERVEFRPEARDAEGLAIPVRVHLSVDEGAMQAVKTDTAAFIGLQGALGEPFVELVPGSMTAPVLQAGGALRGIDPPRTDLLIARLFDVLETAATVMIEDKDSFRRLLRSATGIIETADSVLRERRQDLSQAVGELALAAADARRAARGASEVINAPEMRQMFTDSAAVIAVVRRDLPERLDTFGRLLDRADALTKDLKPEDAARAQAALKKYGELADELRKTADALARVMAAIEKGEGSIGGFYKDPKVYDDLREMLTDLRKNPWKFLWKE